LETRRRIRASREISKIETIALRAHVRREVRRESGLARTLNQRN
jgi:hypothetical protein